MTERVRLLSVIHGPTFGGAHNQAVELSGPLRAAGVETLVVLPVEATAATGRLRAAGVEVFPMELGRLRAIAHPRAHLRLLSGGRRELRALRGLMRRERIDVVQAHGPTNPQAAIAARGEDVGVVWQLLDTRAPMTLRRLCMPLVTRLADVVTSWGAAVARAHPGATRLGERLIVVFPPVRSDLAPSEPGRRAAQETLGVEPGKPAVGTLGVLTPQKGQEEMLRAAEQLLDRDPRPAIRLIGAPSSAHPGYERRLRGLARRIDPQGANVSFFDPGSAPRELLQGLDVLAMTSVPRSEGMPTVILEGMALEKPVVATDVGSTRELVVDGVTGFVVAPGRPDAVASGIARLLDDEGLRRRMGEAARRLARERFGIERLAELHLAAYRRAAVRGSPRA